MNNRPHPQVSIGLTVLAAACFLCASGTQAGIYDDTKAWWHFDNDANSNSLVELGEIKDQRRYSNGGEYKATSTTGSLEWTSSVPLTGPGGGQSYGGSGMLFTPAAASSPDSFSVSGLTLSADATLATRFKWDGYNTGQSYAWLTNNAYTGGQGWLSGFVGGTPRFSLLVGGSGYHQCTWDWEIGAWYDFAFVIDDNGDSDSITFYRWKDGGQFESQTLSGGAWISSSTIGGNMLIGSENTGSSGNGLKAFKGTMDNLALWDSALSEADIHEAFGSPNPVWSIGLDNNSPYDMEHESYVPDPNYSPGDPWGEMPRAITSSRPSAFVNFDLTAEQAALNQVFHIDLHGFGGAGTADVKINGTTLGSLSQTDGYEYSWLIPAGTFQEGTNTLEIARTGGVNVVWDWLELGGSWQLGVDDGDHAEFSIEHTAGDDFYVTDPNMGEHLERALTTADTDLNLHFFLSEELSGYDFLYTMKTVEMWGPFGSFDVSLNGSLVGTFPGGGQGTYFTLPISGRFAQSGENVLTLHYTAASGNVVFDFHRMEIVPEPTSLLLFGLGLLALTILRRRRD